MNKQTLRVATVRSQNPKGIGGCIFTGVQIDQHGNVLDARSYMVVRASNHILGRARVQVGQWWSVSGELTQNEIVVNGYKLTEWQVSASHAEMLLPSGEHIVTLIAENADFKGIGWVKARKLWETFGDELYRILDERNVPALTKVLSEDTACTVLTAWSTYGDTRTLSWLQANGFNTSIGRQVLAFFGTQTVDKIEADPYRLLSFCATWAQVDTLARERFGITDADPRRLQGAIEEACYRLFNAGHTVATQRMLIEHLALILNTHTQSCPWRQLIPQALSQGLTNGSYVIGTDGRLHPLGPFVMETGVARSISRRIAVGEQTLLSDFDIKMLTKAYEEAEGITLNPEQRAAVQTANANDFALITGGAGVGKTTVLKALHQMYEAAGWRVYQMALAGRAAKRMQEATGRPASTIANFLRKTDQSELEGHCAVIVDEASMTDVITMSRLCDLLPAHVRLLLVGDPHQLMPVGPGLVLHSLVQVAAIPQIELTVTKRYGGAIADAAHSIREGIWPDLPNDESAPIAFLPCDVQPSRYANVHDETLGNKVLRLYAQNTTSTQIISPIRNGLAGTKTLNALCQSAFTGTAPPLLVWSNEYAAKIYTGFRLGDVLLCTKNMWDWGLQNGALGRLFQIEDEPRLLRNEDGNEIGNVLAWVEWDDGERRPLLETMLDYLELGYVVTVHKAQGSQWGRVIVPITGNRLLDRTLVYTAVTRAQQQVILVGDKLAARRAVEGLPRARQRRIALGALLTDLLPREVPL
ncbi:ATP-dependent RecD-like DNA helicase [Paraburkholderia sp. BCC1884]|uniref:ATP-dependent DNA helicase n=1 Tax=Paraburkholderia sp. BCC1884 TaxID=2562668 RepID=UPI0011821E28|nr:AAA family ATPase [Paraburkholderia sp. BCC1884]